MKKVIALSAALAAAGAFSASAQETAPTTDPATPPAATDTTTPPATDTTTPPAGDMPANDTTTAPAGDMPATTDSTTPPAGDMPDASSGGTGTGMNPATDDTTPSADTGTSTMPSTDMEATPPATDTDATDTMAPDTMAPTDSAAAPMGGDMQVPEGYTLYSGEPMTAENLQDAAVYASDDSSVGNISDFVLAEDGSITQVIFDVGGFLGIGARNVAVPFEELQIYTNADATDMRVYLPMTKEELEALPEYTES